MPLPERSSEEPVEVVVVLTPMVSMLGFLNVAEVFRAVNRASGLGLYRIVYASADGGPVQCANGMSVAADIDLRSVKTADILVAAASYPPAPAVMALILPHIRRIARHGARLCGVDYGVAILGEAGLLDEHDVSIHWELRGSFEHQFPEVRVGPGIYTIDRNVMTCGGLTTGLDMTLEFVTRQHGRELGLAVARELLYAQPRLPDAPQTPVAVNDPIAQNAILHRTNALMMNRIDVPTDIGTVARLAGISRRNLENLTAKYLGLSPARYYLQLRLFRGRELLLYTQMPVTEVAHACGFKSATAFSRAFRQQFDAAPSNYRSEFQSGFRRPFARGLV